MKKRTVSFISLFILIYPLVAACASSSAERMRERSKDMDQEQMIETTTDNEVENKEDNIKVEDQPTIEEKKDDLIPKSELKRVLNDMHKFKSKYRELEEQLKQREVSELRKREEWKQLAEKYEQESQDYRGRFEGLQSALVRDKKISEVKTHALKSGIRQEALADLEMLDLDDVEIETTSTGRYNVLGADKFVNRLKVSRPHWFGRNVGSVNSKDPEVVKAQEVSYEKLMKAADQARKTGNYDEYEKMLRKYKEQKQ